jgi:hypothetical protein
LRGDFLSKLFYHGIGSGAVRSGQDNFSVAEGYAVYAAPAVGE